MLGVLLTLALEKAGQIVLIGEDSLEKTRRCGFVRLGHGARVRLSYKRYRPSGRSRDKNSWLPGRIWVQAREIVHENTVGSSWRLS